MGVPIAPIVSPPLVFSKVTTGRPWIGCNGLQLPGLPRHHVRLAHGKKHHGDEQHDDEAE